MKKKISLIDFEAGNLHSVYKAVKFIGANVDITSDPDVIEKSDAVILPGVGAFGAVMDSINKSNLKETIIKEAKSGKPFLGICVGMQVLFEEGEENPEVEGLGIFKGKVVKFKKAKRIPHIGWNDSIPVEALHAKFLQKKFYFVHSYYVIPEDKSLIASEAECDGEKFTSVIKKNNLIAVQFHPEKSGEAGLELLKWFVNLE